MPSCYLPATASHRSRSLSKAPPCVKVCALRCSRAGRQSDKSQDSSAAEQFEIVVDRNRFSTLPAALELSLESSESRPTVAMVTELPYCATVGDCVQRGAASLVLDVLYFAKTYQVPGMGRLYTIHAEGCFDRELSHKRGGISCQNPCCRDCSFALIAAAVYGQRDRYIVRPSHLT